ncbi:MAG: MBL fold metallo-hydrolase, partial [bacterium]|nr:MBL fold metallo-hydrolase [bacterium]
CFKLSGNQIDVNVVIDPYDSSLGLKTPRLSADVIVVTGDTPDRNSWQQVKSSDNTPFIVQYPGEYEVKGVFAMAVTAKKKDASDTLLVSLGVDDVNIGHLGSIDRALTESELDALGRIDVLLLPVGGAGTLDAETAIEVLKQIEPRIVVPMQYAIPGLNLDSQPLEKFLKEYGLKDVEKLDKLKVQKRDLPSEDTRVVVINPS